MDNLLELDYAKEIQAPFTDSLTGLFNHGFFQICLDREVARCARYRDTFTLVLIDIDGYGAYNKKCGPVQGDRILREIAGMIRDNMGETDLTARYDSGTLAVIVTKANDPYPSIEEIRRAVEKRYNGMPTVSAGLAVFPRDAITKEGIIKKAQEALSQAKMRGKNKVFYYKKDVLGGDSHKPKVLVVDDQQFIVKILTHMLLPLDYEVYEAHSGQEALQRVNETDVDLILLDVMMPGMDGYEVCRRLKQGETTRLIPVIMLTGLEEIEAKIKGIEAGADDFLTKPMNQTELLARTKSLIKVKTINSNLTGIEGVLVSLAKVVEAKDLFTEGHVLRVSQMATDLGKSLGVSGRELEAVKLGGILHDIGKISVPASVLNKPGPLDAEEWGLVKTHPEVGYKVCLPLKKTLGPALEIIRHHHEKLDGSGYPDGLRGDEITLASRIMAVVDTYDALTVDRPHHKAVSKQEAVQTLRKEVEDGKLDGKIVEILVEE